jgi:hypothetical protein
LKEDLEVSEGLRARLIATLDTEHPADQACRQELASGARLGAPSGEAPAAHFVEIYARRIRHLRSKGTRFVGEDLVERINISPHATLRVAGVRGRDNFTIFLAPTQDEVVATIGVDGAVANQDFVYPESEL